MNKIESNSMYWNIYIFEFAYKINYNEFLILDLENT